jgi:hypothetical protein
MMLRRIIGEIDCPSPGVRRNAMVRLGTILDDAVREERIGKRDLRGLFEFAFFTGMRPRKLLRCAGKLWI